MGMAEGRGLMLGVGGSSSRSCFVAGSIMCSVFCATATALKGYCPCYWTMGTIHTCHEAPELCESSSHGHVLSQHFVWRVMCSCIMAGGMKCNHDRSWHPPVAGYQSLSCCLLILKIHWLFSQWLYPLTAKSTGTVPARWQPMSSQSRLLTLSYAAQTRQRC